MRDDLADAVRLVAAGVVAVVMRVEQHGDALGRALLQAGRADRGGVHELAVDRNRAVGVHEIADRAAGADEHADAATQLLEPRDRRRRGLCRRLRSVALGGRARPATFRDKTTPAATAVDEDMNCLRFMESSRPRDSTTSHRRFRARLVDWLLATSIALAVIVSLVGIDFKIGARVDPRPRAGSRPGRRDRPVRDPVAHRDRVGAGVADAHRTADLDLRQRDDLVSFPAVHHRRRRFVRLRQREPHAREWTADRSRADCRMVDGAESAGDRIAAWLGSGAGWLRHRANLPHRRVGADGAVHAGRRPAARCFSWRR